MAKTTLQSAENGHQFPGSYDGNLPVSDRVGSYGRNSNSYDGRVPDDDRAGSHGGKGTSPTEQTTTTQE